MAANNIKDVIRKLVALQAIDTELYEYKRELKGKPALLDDLKARYERKKSTMERLEANARELERVRKARELDLMSKEQGIVNANAQLMTLKTNREYQAKLFEIENFKADKSVLEEEILRTMDQLEKLGADIAREREFLAQEEKKYLAEKEQVLAVIAGLEDKVGQFDSRRREATMGIDPAILSVYERVVENREGSAIVAVTGNACGGCFMHLPPQMINRIKMYQEIVRCEMCTRFLYLQDEL